MWKLVIEDDEGKRTVVHLTRDQYTVGRKEGNAIRLTERNISREHAKLAKRSDGDGAAVYLLEDLDSELVWCGHVANVEREPVLERLLRLPERHLQPGGLRLGGL